MASRIQIGKLIFRAALALAVTAAGNAPILLAAVQDPGAVMKKALDKRKDLREAGAKHEADVTAAQKGDGQTAAPKTAAPKTAAPKTAAPPATAPKTMGKESTPMPAAQKKGMPKEAMPKQGAKSAPKKGMAKGEAKGAEKRDPFVVPLRKPEANTVPAILPPGNAGLLVAQVNLIGIVKTPKGMTAVVTGTGGRTFFLHENDKIFNGQVAKITGDSLVLEETIIDPLGKIGKREVVKKMPAEAK
jgi:hypothetical protein